MTTGEKHLMIRKLTNSAGSKQSTKSIPTWDITIPAAPWRSSGNSEVQPEFLSFNLLMKWKICNMDRATANLEDFLAKPPDQQAMMAINRLKAAWNDQSWTPDVAIKCFNDIDRAYFGRQMKDRVMLYWRESVKTIRHDCGPSYLHRLGFTTGGSFDGLPPTVQIQLNAQLIFCSKAPGHNGVRQTFGTLAHECIHGGYPRFTLWT